MQMKCVPQLDWVEFLETANKCPYQATESEELGPDSGLNFSVNLPDSPACQELPQGLSGIWTPLIGCPSGASVQEDHGSS